MMMIKLLERLDRKRFAPHVISLTTLGELSPIIIDLGIPVVAIGMKPGRPNLLSFLRLVRIIKRLSPEIVHTWMYHADLIGGLAARLSGVSALGWCIRNSDLDKHGTKTSTRVVVRLCALISKWVPSKILSCSENARQAHVECGYEARKILVVPNGFDLSRFKPDEHARKKIRSELGVSINTPLVGLIGRFHPQKNHKGFFEAASILHRRMPNVHFVLAGKGVDSCNLLLTQAASQASVLDNTHFLGLRNDMPELMAALDVLVSSASYGEAFPNVIGEAMACGVSCVVTDVGDSASIVGDAGKVVSRGDMAGLANALEEFLTLGPSLRLALSKRAREIVAENFEIEKVVLQYESFYERLLNNAE